MLENGYAHSFRGYFIITDGFHRPSVTGVGKIADNQDSKDRPCQTPVYIGIFRDPPLDAQSPPVGDWNKVVGQHYDYLAESEGGNGR